MKTDVVVELQCWKSGAHGIYYITVPIDGYVDLFKGSITIGAGLFEANKILCPKNGMHIRIPRKSLVYVRQGWRVKDDGAFSVV